MSIYRWAKLDDQSGPDRSIELTLGFVGDGVEAEVVAEALLFLAEPRFRHTLPVDQVWHGLFAGVDQHHNPARLVWRHQIRPPCRSRLPVQILHQNAAGIGPRSYVKRRLERAVSLAQKDT